MRINPLWQVIAGLAVAMPAAAVAVPITYQATLTPLSGFDVSGTATLVLRQDDNALDVTINASGLVPNAPHPQHIHGRFNSAGEPIDSFSPTLAQDDDDDGFIELLEGAETYGPIIVPLTSPPGGDVAGFPTAPDGTITFTQTYDLLADATYAAGFDVNDLLPLDLREIVLHGGFAPPGPGAEGIPTVPGSQTAETGTPVYIAALPVASGVIELQQVNGVPEPATIWLLLIGFAATALGLRGRSQAFRA